jgi:D-alanyl-D-alanine dipeptidase
MKHTLLSLMLYVFFIQAAQAQGRLNSQGLNVINHPDSFLASIAKDPGKKMIDIKRKIPAILLDIKYCSPDNFMKRRLYPLLHTTY